MQPATGKATFNVLKMAKEGLSFEIRNALLKAKLTGKPFIKKNIEIENAKRLVTIEAVPLTGLIDLHFLILFKEEEVTDRVPTAKIAESSRNAAKHQTSEKDNRIHLLSKELAQVREDMRNITEDQEITNEELQSANEELLSTNEELQSLNEELETNKEELQSTNEELITVNQALYDKNEDVNHSRKLLELNAAMVHDLFMNSPGFICTLMGPTHVYTLVNPSYQKLFGSRKLTGKPIMEALPELEGQGFDVILHDVFSKGKLFVGNEIPILLAADIIKVAELRYFNFSY